MSFKIQSKTIFGWFDLVGFFPTIKEATEKIPKLEKMMMEPYPLSDICILRIVDSSEKSVNENFVYDIDEL